MSYHTISWSLEAVRLVVNYCITLKFDLHIGRSAAKLPVKFQSDQIILNTNLATSWLHEILQQDVLSNIWILKQDPKFWYECQFFLPAMDLCDKGLPKRHLQKLLHYDRVLHSLQTMETHREGLRKMVKLFSENIKLYLQYLSCLNTQGGAGSWNLPLWKDPFILHIIQCHGFQ